MGSAPRDITSGEGGTDKENSRLMKENGNGWKEAGRSRQAAASSRNSPLQFCASTKELPAPLFLPAFSHPYDLNYSPLRGVIKFRLIFILSIFLFEEE